MGLRACAIKRYVVEYGDTNGFNWGADTLYNIISAFCEDFFCGGDDYANVDVIWEVDKYEFSEMIKDIEKMDEAEFKQKMEDEWHADTLDDECTTKEYVLRKLKAYYEESDPNSDLIRLAWF